MRILIDIGHPAHVHLFKYFAVEMMKKGNEVLFTASNKEFETYLLRHYGFEYKSLGSRFKSIPGKIFGLLKFDFKIILEAIKFKPDIFISHGSMYAAQSAFLLRKPHIALEDTGNREQVILYLPFSKAVLTPEVLRRDYGNKHIKYNGYHELFYLHPNYYRFDKSIYNLLGLDEKTQYSIIRFVAWQATHDMGHKKLSMQDKIKIVNAVSTDSRVFISSENALPEELRKFEIKIPPEMMHHALAGASLFVGEGATMASEAGLLGTPSIYTNTLYACNNEDQVKYGTVFQSIDVNEIIGLAHDVLIKNKKATWYQKTQRIIADKISPTAFLIWFIEDYPNSLQKIKSDPNYVNYFK